MDNEVALNLNLNNTEEDVDWTIQQASDLSDQFFGPNIVVPFVGQDQENPCGCKPRVLCVDDIIFNLTPILSMIRMHYGLEPEIAVNGSVAVDMYKASLEKECQCVDRSYKLIFMDVQMPVMDGLEAS